MQSEESGRIRSCECVVQRTSSLPRLRRTGCPCLPLMLPTLHGGISSNAWQSRICAVACQLRRRRAVLCRSGHVWRHSRASWLQINTRWSGDMESPRRDLVRLIRNAKAFSPDAFPAFWECERSHVFTFQPDGSYDATVWKENSQPCRHSEAIGWTRLSRTWSQESSMGHVDGVGQLTC